jgi:rubredoxin
MEGLVNNTDLYDGYVPKTPEELGIEVGELHEPLDFDIPTRWACPTCRSQVSSLEDGSWVCNGWDGLFSADWAGQEDELIMVMDESVATCPACHHGADADYFLREHRSLYAPVSQEEFEVALANNMIFGAFDEDDRMLVKDIKVSCGNPQCGHVYYEETVN